mgnify:CR=1 FL=1
MNREVLAEVAAQLVGEGKGVLAADESSPTLTKRFDSLGVTSTEESRRSYREMLFSTPGLSRFISGVIMYDETIHQSVADGTPFPSFLAGSGILPGIKVDTGAKPLAGAPHETVTEGLDGLRDRLSHYRDIGARFAKWRAVIAIGDGIPSGYCLHTNAHALARYAALCQEANIVPIVEPEVMMEGDHSLETCLMTTTETLKKVFDELHDQRVFLGGIILKANMVLPGKDCPEQAPVEEVAAATISCMRAVVPAEVPGIAFLSGGQTDEDASAHLNAMNRTKQRSPWQLTFSYARALQGPALRIWAADQTAIEQAQQALHHRAKMNSLARSGRYSAEAEKLDDVAAHAH